MDPVGRAAALAEVGLLRKWGWRRVLAAAALPDARADGVLRHDRARSPAPSVDVGAVAQRRGPEGRPPVLSAVFTPRATGPAPAHRGRSQPPEHSSNTCLTWRPRARPTLVSSAGTGPATEGDSDERPYHDDRHAGYRRDRHRRHRCRRARDHRRSGNARCTGRNDVRRWGNGRLPRCARTCAALSTPPLTRAPPGGPIATPRTQGSTARASKVRPSSPNPRRLTARRPAVAAARPGRGPARAIPGPVGTRTVRGDRLA